MDHISGLYYHSFNITIFLIFQQMNNIGADLIGRFMHRWNVWKLEDWKTKDWKRNILTNTQTIIAT